MLNGTDLMSAYQPFDSLDVFGSNSGNFANFNNEDDNYNETNSYKNISKQEIQSSSQSTLQEQSKKQLQQEQQKKQIQQLQDLLNKSQQKYNQESPQQVYSPSVPNIQYPPLPMQYKPIQLDYNSIKVKNDYIEYQPTYFEKLSNKKKDLGKLIQFTLIIVLGLSIHYLIDYYLNNYISNSDFSFERKLILRLLYPLSVLFILWNLKVFVR